MEDIVKLDDDTLEPVSGGMKREAGTAYQVYRCTNPRCENYASDFPAKRCPVCGGLAEAVRCSLRRSV